MLRQGFLGLSSSPTSGNRRRYSQLSNSEFCHHQKLKELSVICVVLRYCSGCKITYFHLSSKQKEAFFIKTCTICCFLHLNCTKTGEPPSLSAFSCGLAQTVWNLTRTLLNIIRTLPNFTRPSRNFSAPFSNLKLTPPLFHRHETIISSP